MFREQAKKVLSAYRLPVKRSDGEDVGRNLKICPLKFKA